MKAKKTYLKGKSVFIVSLIVIGITILTVYLAGINYNRSIASNLYISMSIIAGTLFLFMNYGLYYGIGLIDNFPKFRKLKSGSFIKKSGEIPELPEIDAGDGIGGLIISILLWIVMTILFIVLLIFMEAIFWFSLFIILTMLYWIFFRALKFVFSKSSKTKGNIGASIGYALSYTVLYTGWIFLITYLTESFR